jgi:hypothetical protein
MREDTNETGEFNKPFPDNFLNFYLYAEKEIGLDEK